MWWVYQNKSHNISNLLFFNPLMSGVVWLFRNSRPEMFCKKGVLRNFAKFIGKHLCQSLFFNKVADFRPATLLKNRLWHRCFPVNLTKFLRTLFLTKHTWWLLLTFQWKPGVKGLRWKILLYNNIYEKLHRLHTQTRR